MTPVTVAYKAVDGRVLEADVYAVTGAPPAPVVVLLHGGALIGGCRTDIRPVLRDLCLHAGFAQVSVDYRLAPATKLPQIIEDLRDAFRWVRGEGAVRFRFDPARIAVMGWSAGGYLALMCGFCVEPRPRALVSYAGYGDIAGSWLSEPDPFSCQQPRVSRQEAYEPPGRGSLARRPSGSFYLYCRQNGLWPLQVTGFDPRTQPEAIGPFCPVRNVDGAFPPTLLFHGTADTDVPYQQSADMANVLQAAGVDCELVPVDGGGHGFDDGVRDEDMLAAEPSPGARAFRRTVEFLHRHLR